MDLTLIERGNLRKSVKPAKPIVLECALPRQRDVRHGIQLGLCVVRLATCEVVPFVLCLKERADLDSEWTCDVRALNRDTLSSSETVPVLMPASTSPLQNNTCSCSTSAQKHGGNRLGGSTQFHLCCKVLEATSKWSSCTPERLPQKISQVSSAASCQRSTERLADTCLTCCRRRRKVDRESRHFLDLHPLCSETSLTFTVLNISSSVLQTCLIRPTWMPILLQYLWKRLKTRTSQDRCGALVKFDCGCYVRCQVQGLQ